MSKDFFNDIIIWEQYKFPENIRIRDNNYVFKNIKIMSAVKMTNIFKGNDYAIAFDFIAEDITYSPE